MTVHRKTASHEFGRWLLDVGKIIEGGMKSDNKMVLAYAKHLKDKLESEGDHECARRIDQILHNGHGGSMGVAHISRSSAGRPPVDSESRLPMADETFRSVHEIDLILRPDLQDSVDTFLQYLQASECLMANGVGLAASMILCGPPGCGKTQLATYIAASLKMPLLTARADTLISSYLGSTSKNLRYLFDHATSRPCVLFLDEFDAIAKMRDDSQELGELKRVVISLLQNIDAMGGEHVLIAATNHPHLLDPAVWRRFNFHLEIGLPEFNERKEMAKRFLRDFSSEGFAEFIATMSDGYSGSEVRRICEDSIREAIIKGAQSLNWMILIRQALSLNRKTRSFPQSSKGDLVRALTAIAPDKFSQRQLAEIFDVKQPTISYYLKGGEE